MESGGRVLETSEYYEVANSFLDLPPDCLPGSPVVTVVVVMVMVIIMVMLASSVSNILNMLS